MELVKTVFKIRCEMGACKNMADYTVRMDRVGVRCRLHICRECLVGLCRAAQKELGGNVCAETQTESAEEEPRVSRSGLQRGKEERCELPKAALGNSRSEFSSSEKTPGGSV